MKMSEVGYEESKIEELKKIPLVKFNMKAIELDFMKTYSGAMETDFDLTAEQVAQIKTDLFMAFCFGISSASDPTSTLRRTYVSPPKIITQSKKIIT